MNKSELIDTLIEVSGTYLRIINDCREPDFDSDMRLLFYTTALGNYVKSTSKSITDTLLDKYDTDSMEEWLNDDKGRYKVSRLR